MRRVVVTGLGMVTPLGSGVDHNWSEITAGKSGISKIENFDVSDISCRIAGQVLSYLAFVRLQNAQEQQSLTTLEAEKIEA